LKIAKDHPHWKRMRFKNNKVWMAVDADERPMKDNNKVLIKYQLNQPHEYWVHLSKIMPLESSGAASAKKPASGKKVMSSDKPVRKPHGQTKPSEAECAEAVCIYTDGACSGNPGPAGIGAVLRYKDKRRELSRPIGEATNNIAELKAIREALKLVKNRDLPVIVFTDSSYALGLLVKGWKAKQNIELVEEIRTLAANFKRLRFVKVRGHAGDPDNERADRLAVDAIERA